MKDTITLNYEEYSALCSMVDYMHDDELDHYEECLFNAENSGEDEGADDHIWHSVKTLSLKLKEHQMKENPADRDDRHYHEEQDHIAMEKAKENK